jgi:hypothetical protein
MKVRSSLLKLSPLVSALTSRKLRKFSLMFFSLSTYLIVIALRYRSDGGDELLQEHFKNAPSNATYISKTSQNEVISIIGDSIQRSIVNDCNEAGGWICCMLVQCIYLIGELFLNSRSYSFNFPCTIIALTAHLHAI